MAQLRELAPPGPTRAPADQLAAAEAVLLDDARNLPFEAFKLVVRRWEQLADVDGAHRSHEDAHTGRHAGMCEIGDSFHLDALFGAAQGVTMRNILDHFTNAEFAAEWAELTARHGDTATPTMIERTASQRRADALAAIFDRAASADPTGDGPDPSSTSSSTKPPGTPTSPAPRRPRRRTPGPGHRRQAALPNRRRHPVRSFRRDRRRRRRSHPPHGRQRRRSDHRPRTQLPLLHRSRPHRRPPPRRPLHLPRLHTTPLPDRPHRPLGPRRQYQPGQRRAALSPPQPLENPRLPHLARPQRPMDTYPPDGTELLAA